MFTVLELATAVILASVGWFLVGWSVGYKEGIKDGFNRGKAAGMRTARDVVAKVMNS